MIVIVIVIVKVRVIIIIIILILIVSVTVTVIVKQFPLSWCKTLDSAKRWKFLFFFQEMMTEMMFRPWNDSLNVVTK